MDKKINFSGGDPDLREDHIDITQGANREAIHAAFAHLAVGSNPNFIITGCVVTVGGVTPNNTWSLAAGYIYLNGEMVQVDAQSGSFDSGTQFLAFSKSTTYNINGDKTYNDGTPRQTWQVNRGVITVKSGVLSTELDAINGDNILSKTKAYIGDSSTTNKGIVEKATTTERDLGAADKFIDASLLNSMTSTTARKGIVEKSTTQEADNGVADKFIDASILKNATGGSWIPITINSGFVTQTGYELSYRVVRGNVQITGAIINSGGGSGVVGSLPSGTATNPLSDQFFSTVYDDGTQGNPVKISSTGDISFPQSFSVNKETYINIIVIIG